MTPVTAVACEAPTLQPMSFSPGPLSARSWFAATLVALLIVGLIAEPRREHHGSLRESKVDIIRMTTAKYAYEAFPQWAADHPDRACPTSLRDLHPYMERRDTKDPYGEEYVFTCGGGKLYAMSLGADGTAGTADDVWSHE
jgi:hypothetical protein